RVGPGGGLSAEYAGAARVARSAARGQGPGAWLGSGGAGRIMARGDQIQRHWNLLKLLQTRGAGLLLRDVASELEVSERTIQRDFELLQELGFPLEHEDDEIGRRYWRLPRDFIRSGPLVLSLTEALSLHLA